MGNSLRKSSKLPVVSLLVFLAVFSGIDDIARAEGNAFARKVVDAALVPAKSIYVKPRDVGVPIDHKTYSVAGYYERRNRVTKWTIPVKIRIYDHNGESIQRENGDVYGYLLDLGDEINVSNNIIRVSQSNGEDFDIGIMVVDRRIDAVREALDRKTDMDPIFPDPVTKELNRAWDYKKYGNSVCRSRVYYDSHFNIKKASILVTLENTRENDRGIKGGVMSCMMNSLGIYLQDTVRDEKAVRAINFYYSGHLQAGMDKDMALSALGKSVDLFEEGTR